MKKDFVSMFITWYKLTNWFYSEHSLELDDERVFKHPVTRNAFYVYRAGYNKAIREMKGKK